MAGLVMIGIQRHGVNIVNPGADDELQAGDQVLLLGTRAQLDSAQAVFLKPA